MAPRKVQEPMHAYAGRHVARLRKCVHRREAELVKKLSPYSHKEALEILREACPGCGCAVLCSRCRAWEQVAGQTMSSRKVGEPLSRPQLVMILVEVAEEAKQRGFTYHQKRHPIDVIEEGSAGPAPDSEELTELIEKAQAEVDRHADFPSAKTLDLHDTYEPWDVGGPPRPDRKKEEGLTDLALFGEPEFRALFTALAQELAARAVTPGEVDTLARIFVTWSAGKLRPVINFSNVNKKTADLDVKYGKAADLARMGRWFVKIDLKQAFHQVRVPKAARNRLGFAFRGAAMQFACRSLPLGWKASPALFGSALQPTIEKLRTAGIKLIAYVDDIGIAADTPEQCVRDAITVLQALREDGWTVSAAKCFLRPVKELRFLGLVVAAHGGKPMIAISPSIRRKAETEFKLAEDENCPYHLLSVWGIASFAASAVPRLALWRATMDDLARSIMEADGEWPANWTAGDKTLAIDAAREVLAAVQLATAEGFVRLDHDETTITIAPDVSGYAVGAVMQYGALRSTHAAHLTVDEAALPSQPRELIGALRVLEHWSPFIRGKTVDLRMDAQSAVRSLEGLRARNCAARLAIAKIMELERELDCTIVPTWYSRDEDLQQEADAHSKLLKPPRPRPYLEREHIKTAMEKGQKAFDVHLEAAGCTLAATAYTSAWPLHTAAERGLEWLGPTSAVVVAGWAFAFPTRERLPATASAFRRAPPGSRLTLVMSENAPFSSYMLLSGIWKWYESRVPLVLMGQPLKTIAGTEISARRVPARHSWFAYRFWKKQKEERQRHRTREEVKTDLVRSEDVEEQPGMMEAWERAARDPATTVDLRALMRIMPPKQGMSEPTMAPTMAAVLVATEASSVDLSLELAKTAGWKPLLGPLADQVAYAIAEIDADRGLSTQQRAARAARLLLAFAGETGSAAELFTLAELDVLALAWARARLRLVGARVSSSAHPASAGAVAADIGAMIARLRRRLPYLEIPEGSGGGDLCTALLRAKGAGARYENSPKRPVWGWELRWGLEHNPEVLTRHRSAVICLLCIGVTMWRSLYVRLLKTTDVAVVASMAVRTYAVRWARSHKTRRHVGNPGVPSEPKVGFIACQWVLDLLEPRLATAIKSPSTDEPLFPDDSGAFPSYTYLVKVLRLLLRGLPGAEEATLHGLRLANDIEMKMRGVEEEVRDFFGWWKRVIRRMGEHYEAIMMARLVAASEGYGSLAANTLLPGVVTTSGEYVSMARHASEASAVGGAPVLASSSAALQWAFGESADGALGAALPRGPQAPRQITCTRCTDAGNHNLAIGHNRASKACPTAVAEAASASNVPDDDASESGSDSDDDLRTQPPVRLTAGAAAPCSLAGMIFQGR